MQAPFASTSYSRQQTQSGQSGYAIYYLTSDVTTSGQQINIGPFSERLNTGIVTHDGVDSFVFVNGVYEVSLNLNIDTSNTSEARVGVYLQKTNNGVDALLTATRWITPNDTLGYINLHFDTIEEFNEGDSIQLVYGTHTGSNTISGGLFSGYSNMGLGKYSWITFKRLG